MLKWLRETARLFSDKRGKPLPECLGPGDQADRGELPGHGQRPQDNDGAAVLGSGARQSHARRVVHRRDVAHAAVAAARCRATGAHHPVRPPTCSGARTSVGRPPGSCGTRSANASKSCSRPLWKGSNHLRPCSRRAMAHVQSIGHALGRRHARLFRPCSPTSPNQSWTLSAEAGGSHHAHARLLRVRVGGRREARGRSPVGHQRRRRRWPPSSARWPATRDRRCATASSTCRSTESS